MAVASPKQKLVAAGAALGVGLGLALLFPRREAGPSAVPNSAEALATTSIAPPSAKSAAVFRGHFSPLAALPAELAATTNVADAPASVPASQSSPSHSIESPSLPLGDLPGAQLTSGRPVYSREPTNSPPGNNQPTSPTYRIHVIHNGDTLERLAERYLADGARALEIFDLNRDVLENPHVLRIGAELKIPSDPTAPED